METFPNITLVKFALTKELVDYCMKGKYAFPASLGPFVFLNMISLIPDASNKALDL